MPKLFTLPTLTVLFSCYCLICSSFALAEEITLASALNHFTRAEYKTAITALEYLHTSNNEQHTEIAFYLARSYYKDGQLKRARNILEQNIKVTPTHAMSHFLLGSVKLTQVADVNLFKKYKLAKSALGSWQRAVALDNDILEARYGIASFYISAPSLVGGDLDKAKLELIEIERISPAYASLVRASINNKLNDVEAAEIQLHKAIKGIPERAFPTLILANFLFKQGRYREAVETVKIYRQRDKKWNDPDESQAALLAGRIYLALKNKVAAKRELESALALKPYRAIRKQIEKLMKEI